MSIKRKLAAINLAITGCALILVGGAVFFDQYRAMKGELLNNLHLQARIVANNCTAALVFDDRKVGAEIVGALRASPSIRHAVISDKNGETFAEYSRPELRSQADGAPVERASTLLGAGSAVVDEPIHLSGEVVGSIRMESDLTPLWNYLGRQLAVIVAVLVSVFGVVWWLVARLHRTITDPLVKLTDLMRLVSENKAYSIRAKPLTNDEVGSLATGFNEMLEQIQKRDDELEEHKLGLERLVGQRTEQLEHMATHDVLTGLPNRQLCMDRLTQAIYQAERSGTLVALLFVDLDHFKDLNDTLGHSAGDLMLKELAARQQASLRKGDTVARFGGDEFVLVLEGLKQPSDVEPEVSRILDVISSPVRIGNEDVLARASVGISLYPQDGDSGERLLRNADTAMYRAKEMGGNNYQYYTEELNVRLVQRMTLQSELRCALDQDQFVLHYQPQVDLTSGRIIGVEALVRWNHPTRGLTSPAYFIPFAEETGLIVAIGEWVLNEACRQAVAWRHAGLPELRMAVNLSAIQFKRTDLVRTVADVLDRTNLPASCLELELTESILLEDTKTAMETLQRLKAMAVHLSIDDFGTGYSSLSYLKHLAVDKLKIDQSFVRDLPEDAEDAAIVRAVIRLGHTLQLDIIAEGVETEGQLMFLQQAGCDEMQGYLFSRPLPAGDIELLLREERSLPVLESGGDGKKTILLVDDEENILNALCRDLRKEGYRILRASSGPEALELLATHPVGVILTDQRMPGMTGAELLHRAKQLHPNTVRMVLSGYTDLNTMTSAINDGEVYKYLVKPWDGDQLRDIVSDAFRHRNLLADHERILREFVVKSGNVSARSLDVAG